MGTTINDIAKKAGVSRATVSRVMSGSASVSSEKSSLILKVAEELGYNRNLSLGGRPRKAKRHGDIALLIPDTNASAAHTALSSKLACGVEKVASDNRYNLLITHLGENRVLPPCLDPVQVDGVIVRMTELYRAIKDSLKDTPAVWVFEPTDATILCDVVQPDNEAVGHMAYKFLEDCDSLIGVCDFSHSASATRYNAFKTLAIRNSKEVFECNSSTDRLIEIITDRSKKCRRLGIFLPIGEGYLDKMEWNLRDSGIKLGEDISIISCNNDQAMVKAINPTLANIDICSEEIGRVAVETLLWRIENPSAPERRILVHPKLIIGSQ